MTLQASGAISISQVATELGISSSGLDLNHARIREITDIAAGTIKLSNLYSKTSFLLTAGSAAGEVGYRTVSPIGSLSPTGDSRFTFQYIEDVSGANFNVGIAGVVAQNVWTKCIINGLTFLSTNASFNNTGTYGGNPSSAWLFSGVPAGLVNTVAYRVVFI